MTQISKSTKLQHIFIFYFIGIPTSATVREHCETSKDSIFINIFRKLTCVTVREPCESVLKFLSIYTTRRPYSCEYKRAL